MKNKLNEYQYDILHQSNYNEDALINIIENHFVNGVTEVYRMMYHYGINKCSLKNLRTLAKNLIAEYYLCHNNKLKNKQHEQNEIEY